MYLFIHSCIHLFIYSCIHFLIHFFLFCFYLFLYVFIYSTIFLSIPNYIHHLYIYLHICSSPRQYFLVLFKNHHAELWDAMTMTQLREFPGNFPSITALVCCFFSCILVHFIYLITFTKIQLNNGFREKMAN